MNQTEQFEELISNIKYGLSKMQSNKWDRTKYYNYMADFFDYIDLPKDAEEHRDLAIKWKMENMENEEKE